MRIYGTSIAALLLFCMTGMGYAQTCNDSIQAATPDSRFEVTGDEVTDLQTGLIWQRCSVGQSWDGSSCSGTATIHTWAQALALASGNWRLPNIKELTSIVETSCVNPAINVSVFPNTLSHFYWSSSPYAYASYQAWNVSFYYGTAYAYVKYLSRYVRLVRGGQ